MGVTTGRRPVLRLADGAVTQTSDLIAVEAPLTIIVDGEVAVTTMRTPGHDLELAAGWLVNESGVRRAADITGMGAFATHDEDAVDTVRTQLAADVRPPRPRAFVTNSSCGVCSADVLAAFAGPSAPLRTDGWTLAIDAVPTLIEGMRSAQRMFDRTGSLHAAAVAGPCLQVQHVREDVGRHNAVDKVIGRALLDDCLPLTDHVLVVSGRVSYEIVHKALIACVSAVVAVSGPTSLAVDLAREHDLVLAGFARDDRVNIYAGADHVRLASTP